MYCKKCSNKIPYKLTINGKERRYDHRKHCFNCRPLGSQSHKPSKGNKYKLACLLYKGNKCQICGYNAETGSISAMHFHHINPKEKKFSISSSYCRSWEEIKSELDKCVLLCSNCHCEVHDGIKECPTEIIKNENVVWPRDSLETAMLKKIVNIDKELLLQKKSNKKLAKELGVAEDTVKKNREKYNIIFDFKYKSKIPEKEILEKLIWSIPMVDIGKKFGVSDNAVRKWCKKLDIKLPQIGYWSKSDHRIKTPRNLTNIPIPSKEVLINLIQNFKINDIIDYFQISKKAFIKWRRQYDIPIGRKIGAQFKNPLLIKDHINGM